MWQTLKEHPRILTVVSVAHVLLLVAMLAGFEFTPRSQAAVLEFMVQPAEDFQVIEAVAVDGRTFDRIEDEKREAERRRIEEARRRAEEAERRRQEEARRQAEAEAERQRQEEARRQAEAEAERRRQAEAEQRRQAQAEAEHRRQEEEARRRAEAEAERKRQEEEARRRAEAEAEQRRREEEARRAEAERQRRLEEERKAEEERRLAALRAEEQRLREEAQRRAREEEARRQAARQARLDSQRPQYIAAIRSAVERNWLRPTGFQSGQMAVVYVRQTPGGYIQEVRIERCTGDAAFCRSVEAAVRKAEPLPDPPDPELFARELRFTFEPT